MQQLLELGDRIGEARRGLTSSEITRLPTKQFVAADGGGGGGAEGVCGESPECSVCCCEYEPGEELRLLPCFHQFHTHCIDKWIKVSIQIMKY